MFGEPMMQKLTQRDILCFTAVLLMVCTILRLWVLPLTQSFWVDESLVVWTIRDGFTQIIPKAFVSLQSVAFCMLEWPLFHAGAREVGLRLPSLAAAIATLWILYRLGAETLDRELGLIFAALYIATPAVAPEVPNARPYALAVLAHTAGLWWLLKWFRSSKLWHGLAWVVCSVIGSYFQHLFLIPFVLEWFYVLMRYTKDQSERHRPLWIYCGAGAVLLIPQLPQLLELIKQGQRLSFVPRPGWPSLVLAAVPVHLVFVLALVLAATWAAGLRPGWTQLKNDIKPATLGLLLLIVPAVVLFGFSKFTAWRYFTQRYLTITISGSILFWGWLIRQIAPSFVREVTVICLLAGINLTAPITRSLLTGPAYHSENWREAVQAMPESGIFLIYPGLVETRRLDWLAERRSYFLAPVTAYRPAIGAADTFIVPFEFSSSTQAYMLNVLSQLPRGRPVTVTTLEGFSGRAWMNWLAETLVSMGSPQLRKSQHGRVSVAVFSAKR